MNDITEDVDTDRLRMLDEAYYALTSELEKYNDKKREAGARIHEMMERSPMLSSDERIELKLLQLECRRFNKQAQPIKARLRTVESERAELHRKRNALVASRVASTVAAVSISLYTTSQDISFHILRMLNEHTGQDHSRALGVLLRKFEELIRSEEASSHAARHQKLEQEYKDVKKELQAEVLRLSALVNTLSQPKPPVAKRLLRRLWDQRVREYEPTKQAQGILHRLQIDADLEQEIREIIGE